MPFKQNLVLFLITAVTCSSCVRYAYYQSPLLANVTAYREVPMQKDSVKPAIYASGMIGGGGANYLLTDGVSTFSAAIHRSNNFGSFQAYYGLSALAGTYDVNRVSNSSGIFSNQSIDTGAINANLGTRGYFAAGGFGGVNIVSPTNFGEWRILGVDVTWHKESGGYAKFRDRLPDKAANYIERRHDFLTIGISTNPVWKITEGCIGWRLAIIWNPLAGQEFTSAGTPERSSSGYISSIIHAQKNNVTGFAQFTTGSRATMVSLGANIKLTK